MGTIKRPKGNGKRDDWKAYADQLEARVEELEADAAGRDCGELNRQLRRRVRQLTSGKG